MNLVLLINTVGDIWFIVGSTQTSQRTLSQKHQVQEDWHHHHPSKHHPNTLWGQDEGIILSEIDSFVTFQRQDKAGNEKIQLIVLSTYVLKH